MFSWITDNFATVIIILLLAVVVVSIVVKLIKDKKNGKFNCGCNCANCAMSGSCHKK